MTSIDEFVCRIAERQSRVAIIGVGYVGLPMLRAFWKASFSVIGYDADPLKIGLLRQGRSYIHQIPDAMIAEMAASPRFEATADVADLAAAEVLIICVPTPLTPSGEPEMGFVTAAAHSIRPYVRPGSLIILESTTFPGATDQLLRPILEEGGLKSGRDFFLAYSPERCDPGNTNFDVTNTPKVIGGEGAAAQRLAEALYREVTSQIVPVLNAATAEAVKLTENIFRSVNIALVNELKIVFDTMGVDIWDVVEAAGTKPFGFMPFYPGPGVGGQCIPAGPLYLAWKARECGVSTRLIELAAEINAAMPQRIVERLSQALHERFARGLACARLLLLGVTYKKNVADIRESPGLRLIELLEGLGAAIDYHDPLVERISNGRGHDASRRSVELNPAAIAAYDAVLIVADHDDVDYASVVSAAKLVVDTRNVTKGLTDGRNKVVKA